jgi:hypothetical protein
MQKPRSYAEIYNDLDGEIVNLAAQRLIQPGLFEKGEGR